MWNTNWGIVDDKNKPIILNIFTTNISTILVSSI